MFPLLLGLAGLAWLVAMGGKEALRQPAAAKADLVPTPSAVSGAGAAESLAGRDAPFDPLALLGSALPARESGWTLSDMLDATRAASKVSVPSDAYVGASYEPAQAPLEPGERVTFRVESGDAYSKDYLGSLEGIYSGPSDDLSEGPASVAVDREAESGSREMASGRYTIAASPRRYEHAFLSRVVWSPVAPASKGLASVSNPPELVEGDKLTLVAVDAFGTTVVWIGQVEGGSASSGYEVVLHKAFKTLRDVGEGKISAPFVDSQARVKLPSTWLVAPASIP